MSDLLTVSISIPWALHDKLSASKPRVLLAADGALLVNDPIKDAFRIISTSYKTRFEV